jgi:hypothetical protein
MDLKLDRKFELKICVDGAYEQWVNEVVNSIENNSLMVFDSKEENPFCDIYRYNEIDKFIKEKASVERKISEYLPLSCQCIRIIDEEADRELKNRKRKKS